MSVEGHREDASKGGRGSSPTDSGDGSFGSSDLLLELRNVAKSFGGVHALRGVSLEVRRGSCHALAGENGAGKSTLGRVIAGIERPDAGTLLLGGAERRFRSPADAAADGIAMVHQELATCPDLSVAENLCLGRWPRRLGVLVDRRGMRERAAALLAEVGASLDVSRPMRGLSPAQEQLVQIAHAVGAGARLLVLDEPTSALSQADAERLFALIASLQRRGVTLLYVSHRLPEIFRLCDRVTVLRDGAVVTTLEIRGVGSMGPGRAPTEDELVRHMIGRDVARAAPAKREPDVAARPALRVRDLASAGRFASISFDVAPGEILGLAGLVGAGRSDVAQAVFGLDRRATGEVEVHGERVPLGDVRRAMAAGLAFVPEDRKRQGLVPGLSGTDNVALASLDRFRRACGVFDRRAAERVTATLFERLGVRARSIGAGDAPAGTLSGGNQQKVVLAKWLARDARVLLVDEPTRGVDVGAKAAIHDLLLDLARQGCAIVLISSELPELLALSTRILVLRRGRAVAELARDAATEETVLRAMAGIGAGSG